MRGVVCVKKSMVEYVRKKPLIIRAKQITNEDYDGFETICAHCISSLVSLDERYIEEKYKDSQHRCSYEDDGYCLKDGDCECKRKIGYIKIPDRYDYNYCYPVVSDYLIEDENGKIKIMRKEEFEEIYEPKNDNTFFAVITKC
jgi:hypothetical protein